MNRPVSVIIVSAGVIFAGARALGDEAANQSRMSKRHTIVQVVDCMKKRMSHDRGTSYNEARRTCKDQVAKQSDNTSSGTLVASATPPKP
jgi:hypothetical protein